MAKHGTSLLVKMLGLFSQSSRRAHVFITICVFTTIVVYISWHRLTNTQGLSPLSKTGSNSNGRVNGMKLLSEKDAPPLKDTYSEKDALPLKESRSEKETVSGFQHTSDPTTEEKLSFVNQNEYSKSERDSYFDQEKEKTIGNQEVYPTSENALSTDQKLKKEQRTGNQDTHSGLLKYLGNLPSIQTERGLKTERASSTKHEETMERNFRAGNQALVGNGATQEQSADKPAFNPLSPIPPSTRVSGEWHDVSRVNKTVAQEVARHNQKLQALLATVDRLKQQQTNYNGQLVKNINDLPKDSALGLADKHKGDASGSVVKENGREKTSQNNDKNSKPMDTDLKYDSKDLVYSKDHTPKTMHTHKTDKHEGEEKEKAVKESNTPRPDSCQSCFHSDFTPVIDHKDYCRQLSEQPIVFLLISSAPDNTDRREAVRETWGAKCQEHTSLDRTTSTQHVSSNQSSTNSHLYRCLFVLGQSKDQKTNEKLQLENQKYNDILQFSFTDAYSNLTYKTMSSLYWAERNCPDVPYIMKTDDDMFLNTELIPIMLTAAPKTNFIGGFCWGSSLPNRDTKSKWYVPLRTYVRQRFPPMCSGTGYIMSHDIVNNVIEASKNIPFFHLEDVYIALCLQKYQVRPVRIKGFNNMFTHFSPCTYRYSVMSSHEVSAMNLRKFWTLMQQCPRHNPSGRELYVETAYPPT